MNAQSMALEAGAVRSPVRGGMFLGFGTFFRKEVQDWVRGRRALVVGTIVTASAVFATLVSLVARAAGDLSDPLMTLDPTANVLLGWGGLTMPIVALLATMSLLSSERDRGTLAWSLTRPLSPTSILVAKWLAAVLVLGLAAVAVPLAVSSGVAVIAYGSLPDLGAVALFGALYMTVPAFYTGLTLALGTAVKGAGGIAGLGFLVMFLPPLIASFVPIVAEISPTEIGGWARAVATGGPASSLTFVSFLGSMAVMTVAAKVVFDRQEV